MSIASAGGRDSRKNRDAPQPNITIDRIERDDRPGELEHERAVNVGADLVGVAAPELDGEEHHQERDQHHEERRDSRQEQVQEVELGRDRGRVGGKKGNMSSTSSGYLLRSRGPRSPAAARAAGSSR